MMQYHGYRAQVEYDDKLHVFQGQVINTRDVVTFQGKSVEELKKAFEDSIEDYLAFCRERGEEPDKPLTDRFTVFTVRTTTEMIQIGLEEIKSALPVFISRVETGETFVIVKAGKPVAELKPVSADTITANATGLRPYALARGEFVVPDDFNDPLPENIIAEFEGR